MTKEQIKHMVDRFLGWKLPENFHPDGGISFKPEFNVEYNAQHGLPPQRHEPSGTNIFDATQAEEMVRYMLEELPIVPLPAAGDVERLVSDLEKIMPPEMRAQWPTLWEAIKEVAAENERMRKALREHVLDEYTDHGRLMTGCLICDESWPRLSEEKHKDDCPLKEPKP